MKMKYKRKINNDLAIVAGQIPEGVIHDTTHWPGKVNKNSTEFF